VSATGQLISEEMDGIMLIKKIELLKEKPVPVSVPTTNHKESGQG
jgi:hypothetical protein